MFDAINDIIIIIIPKVILDIICISYADYLNLFCY